MARKQARRRTQKQPRRIRLPKLRLGRLVAPLVAVAVVAGTYQMSTMLLDRDIESIEISGPFQRVSALKIEEAISDEVDKGFLGADLDTIRQNLVDLEWIDQAIVARRWPNRIKVTVTEQVPAAIWGERGLLNTRGELFVGNARHVPAELPRLSGPDDSSAEVAKRYLSVRDQLIPIGLDLRSVELDPRGAWGMTLTNSVDVRLGRRAIDDRTSLFLDVVANIITGKAAEIDYVDMRYSNGFTIGWKDGVRTPSPENNGEGSEMVAVRGKD